MDGQTDVEIEIVIKILYTVRLLALCTLSDFNLRLGFMLKVSFYLIMKAGKTYFDNSPRIFLAHFPYFLIGINVDE